MTLDWIEVHLRSSFTPPPQSAGLLKMNIDAILSFKKPEHVTVNFECPQGCVFVKHMLTSSLTRILLGKALSIKKVLIVPEWFIKLDTLFPRSLCF